MGKGKKMRGKEFKGERGRKKGNEGKKKREQPVWELGREKGRGIGLGIVGSEGSNQQLVWELWKK